MRFVYHVRASCLVLTLAVGLSAAPPTTVSYQGRLTNSGGAAVPDGSYSVRFSLWSDSTMGIESWSETQNVSVEDGLFTTELGKTGGFFDISVCPPYCDMWLQIEVTIGGSVTTISPRTHFSATPWSLVSRSYYSETSSGAQRGKGIVKGVGGSTNPTQIIILEGDADGDGHAEYSLNDSVSTSSASRRLGHDPDDDGTPDNTAEMIVTPTNSSVAINTKGTGADKNRVIASTYADSVVQISASHYVSGQATREINQRNLPSATVLNTLSRGLSGQVNQVSSIAYPDSAMHEVSSDEDGDGTPESEYRIVAETGGKRADVLLRGRNGSTTGTIRMAASPDSAVSLFEADPDGAGPAFSRGIIVQKPGGSPGSASGSSFRAINTTGTGATVRVGMEASDSAMTVLDCDADGDGKSEAKSGYHVGPVGGGQNFDAEMFCRTDSDDDGTDDYVAEVFSTSDSSGLRLNGLPPGVPVVNSISMTASATGVHVAVGGATCDGTNWINASDKKAKENFERVDGAEILDKISELEITKWNYKSDDRIEHIGPTAQDFKRTFGVGSDGISISTIDPSGIALVAIKELSKQNQFLKKQSKDLATQNRELLQQNAEIKKQVANLAKKIEELSTRK